eukprot:TRINITY_DN6400_c0_g1_i1.p1 TRINITY_DN6400_c0_g1~~TRINITY_DN6400_c0_g1_i1.p1  ORF type:complete len:458 (-),score=67.14 TRINITY_DN6400_c0_g1_i1:40-1413(-)
MRTYSDRSRTSTSSASSNSSDYSYDSQTKVPKYNKHSDTSNPEVKKKISKAEQKLLVFDDLSVVQAHRQKYWEDLEEIFLDEELLKNARSGLVRSFEKHYEKMYEHRDKMKRQAKPAKKIESKEGEDTSENHFVWDFSILGRDVHRLILSMVPPDDGNWISLLLVNKEWNAVFSSTIDINKRIYGESPIRYAIRYKQLASLQKILRFPNVDLRPVILVRGQYNEPSHLLTDAANIRWMEGFKVIFSHNGLDTKWSVLQTILETCPDRRIYTHIVLSDQFKSYYPIDIANINPENLDEVLQRKDIRITPTSIVYYSRQPNFDKVFDAVSSTLTYEQKKEILIQALHKNSFLFVLERIRKITKPVDIKNMILPLILNATSTYTLDQFTNQEGLFFDEFVDESSHSSILDQPVSAGRVFIVKFLINHSPLELNSRILNLAPSDAVRDNLKSLRTNKCIIS